MQSAEKINKIADVITGYTFRGAITENKEGSLYILQAKNLKDGLILSEKTLTKIKFETSHTKAFAQDGDVVISTRGSFKSAVLHSSEKVIASSSVYLLRLKNKDSILPEFLAIFLNSPIGQKYFSLVMTGAAIKLILRKDLENIKVPLLPIEQQKKVVDLFQNMKQQEVLLIRRNKLNNKIVEAAFQQLVEA